MRIMPTTGLTTGTVSYKPGVPVEWPDDEDAARLVAAGHVVEVDEDGKPVAAPAADAVKPKRGRKKADPAPEAGESEKE